MGGNLFTKKRLDKFDFLDIKADVFKKLRFISFALAHREIKIESNRYLGDKSDFGDLDVFTDFKFSIKYLNSLFKFNEEYKINNNCISFSYRNFQVDLIYFDTESFETALNYYQNSDCGNATWFTIL
jgi:hypothetical protein